jgi:hypothetical protein
VTALKSILLHLDAAANGDARLQLAMRLARAHGASVDALYAVLPAVLQYPFAFSGDAPGAAPEKANSASASRRRSRTAASVPARPTRPR